jgi:hypothetical protein
MQGAKLAGSRTTDRTCVGFVVNGPTFFTSGLKECRWLKQKDSCPVQFVIAVCTSYLPAIKERLSILFIDLALESLYLSESGVIRRQ